VFPHPGKDTTPLALRANAQHNHVLHERVLIVWVVPEHVPVVADDGRFAVDELGLDDDGIAHLTVHYGFGESPALAEVVRQAVESGALKGWTWDPSDVTFFLSRGPIHRTHAPGLARWRKALFVAMAHNAADPAAFFQLPRDRTVTMGTEVDV
jgi:KUP system potassium uptake protein